MPGEPSQDGGHDQTGFEYGGKSNWIIRGFEFDLIRHIVNSTAQLRYHVLLQSWIYISIHEVSHMKHKPMHTLQPENASIIQSPKFLCLFLLCFLSDIPFAWSLSWEQECKAGEFQSGLFISPLLPSPCQSGSNSGISSAPTHLTCHGQHFFKELVVLERTRSNNLPELSALR